ncbi:MAG TPA: TolC family protein, partial [Pinirhizobacter sp.]|uniref:TolC family protein n=1 Tax=Pinirhizobacter sp. TaxID=2950432 RepID=UPI002CF6D171
MRLKLLTLAMALAAAPLTSHAEDLLDAYRQARANDPTLAQADAQRLGQHETVVQNRALLLPQVDASLSLNQTQSAGNQPTVITDALGNPVGTSPNTGWVRARSQSLNVSQSVMDFSLYANLKASRSLDAAQEASYQASLQQLATRTATAYFQVLTNMDALAFAKANEQALARQLEQAQQRFDVGLSAITDVQDAKAQHDTSVA